MKTVTIDASIADFDRYKKSVSSTLKYGASALFAVAKVIRRGNVLKVYGYFYSAKGNIVDENGKSKAVLELSVSPALKAVFFVVYLFLFVFLFYDKVIINGQSDPSIFERVKFVFIGFVAWTIPLVLLSLGIERFGQRIKRDIESLKKE